LLAWSTRLVKSCQLKGIDTGNVASLGDEPSQRIAMFLRALSITPRGRRVGLNVLAERLLDGC
jgi:hypothetical protein